MLISDISRAVWSQMQRSHSLKRRNYDHHRAALGTFTPPRSGSFPRESEREGPLVQALAAPRRVRRSSRDTVSRLAEHNISGRLQRDPDRDLRAEDTFRDAQILVLCRAKTRLDDRMGAINNVLRRTPNLRALHIDLGLSAEEVGQLSLDLVPRLEVLDLRFNAFGDEGAKMLPLECVPRLKHLNLAGCDMTLAGLQALRLDCMFLDDLDVRSNLFDVQTAQGILQGTAPRLKKIIVDERMLSRCESDARARL